MTLNEYQKKALSTAIFKPEDKYVYPALKLAGESGEVAEKVGKVIRDFGANFSDTRIRNDLAKELGDVLWYIAAMADSLGFSLDQIGEMNIEKLHSRKLRNKIKGSGDNR